MQKMMTKTNTLTKPFRKHPQRDKRKPKLVNPSDNSDISDISGENLNHDNHSDLTLYVTLDDTCNSCGVSLSFRFFSSLTVVQATPSELRAGLNCAKYGG